MEWNRMRFVGCGMCCVLCSVVSFSIFYFGIYMCVCVCGYILGDLND